MVLYSGITTISTTEQDAVHDPIIGTDNGAGTINIKSGGTFNAIGPAGLGVGGDGTINVDAGGSLNLYGSLQFGAPRSEGHGAGRAMLNVQGDAYIEELNMLGHAESSEVIIGNWTTSASLKINRALVGVDEQGVVVGFDPVSITINKTGTMFVQGSYMIDRESARGFYFSRLGVINLVGGTLKVNSIIDPIYYINNIRSYGIEAAQRSGGWEWEGDEFVDRTDEDVDGAHYYIYKNVITTDMAQDADAQARWESENLTTNTTPNGTVVDASGNDDAVVDADASGNDSAVVDTNATATESPASNADASGNDDAVVNATAVAQAEAEAKAQAETDAKAQSGGEETSGNICFLGSEKVETDQGKIRFDELTTDNTIDNHSIQKIVKVLNSDDSLIFIQKHALGKKLPDRSTFISKNHGIYLDTDYIRKHNLPPHIHPQIPKIVGKNLVRARNLVRIKHIAQVVRSKKDYIYNIILENQGTMIVNNLVCETLSQMNAIGKEF